MGKIDENMEVITNESVEIFDAFIKAADIEVKDEPRFRVYADWKARYEWLIIKWGLERVALLFGLLFILVFIWRTQYTYEVTVIFKALATFGAIVATKRVDAMSSTVHADDASNAIITYINKNKDYFIFLEEDQDGRKLQHEEE